ncbi:MAG: extracellular solute-binding protein, partial [Planctomycetota bacterium]
MFAAGAADALPDVVNFSGSDFPVLASLGALHDLEPIAPTPPSERFVDGALAAGTIDGALFGAPWYLSTPVRVANEELLAEGGLTPETLGATWQELLSQAGPFYDATGKWLLTLPLGEVSQLPAMLSQQGLPPVVRDSDRYHSRLTDEASVAYVRAWIDLYRSGDLPSEAATEGYSHMVRNYVAGNVAMINGNAVRAVATQSPAVYANTRVLPGAVGSTGEFGIAVTFVCVTRQSDQPDLAAKLAWHMTSEPWQERLAKEASRVPSTAASLDDVESFLPDAADARMDIATRLSAQQMARARSFDPPVGAWPDMARIFEDNMQRALVGGVDVRTVLADIDCEWKRILDAEAEGRPYK